MANLCANAESPFFGRSGLCAVFSFLIWAMSATFARGGHLAGTIIFAEDFENANTAGWTMESAGGAGLKGLWEFGDPNGTIDSSSGAQAQPEDAYAGARCAFTAQNSSLGMNDVDDGVVGLVSPTMDLSGAVTAEVSYARWFFNRALDDDSGDCFVVSARTDSGASWIELERLGDDLTANAWVTVTYDLGTAIALTASVQIRFEAADRGFPFPGDVIEAAIDEVMVTASFTCQGEGDCPAGFFCNTQGGCSPYGDGDTDSDSDWDLVDFSVFQSCFGLPVTGACFPANLSGDNIVDLQDLDAFMSLLDGPG